VANVRLLDFGAFEEAVEIGYQHAVQQLQEADLGRLVVG